MSSAATRRRIAGATCALGALGAMTLVGLGAGPAAAADGPVVVLGPIAPIDGVQPGSDFQVPTPFTNTGSTALNKVWIQYIFSRGISHADVPSNCGTFVNPVDNPDVPDTFGVWCEFDQTVKPGVVYAPEHALSLKAQGYAMDEDVQVGVLDGDFPPDTIITPGTAPAVKLVEHPDDPPAAPGGKAYTDVAVTADNTADFQLTAGMVKGKVGDTVPLTVKFTNAGPAWVPNRLGAGGALVRITLPEGVSVVKQGSCHKVTTGTYDCYTSDSWVEENSSDTYLFTLHIDKAVPGAKGSATFNAKYPRPFDHVASNDTAPITLDVTAAPTTPSGTPTTPSAAPNAPGPELAATGADATLPLTAAAAAVLLGTAALVTTRRRRQRG